MTMTISSQHYRNDEIIEAKRAANDYVVTLSPTFEFDGMTMRVILDGHHALEAAKLDGVAPEFVESTVAENEHIRLIGKGEYDEFLLAVWCDGDYYDIETGHYVW